MNPAEQFCRVTVAVVKRKYAPRTPEQKERHRITNQQFYKKNRVQILGNWKQQRATNPDIALKKQKYDAERYAKVRQKKISSAKSNYLKNRPAVIIRIKKWNVEQPERNRKYSAKWRARNPVFKREVNRRWAKRNPDKVRARGHRRRARLLKNSTPEQIKAADLKIKVMLSHRHTDCAYCGKRFLTKKMHVEHIVALARGGSHSPENICMACHGCNESKNARLLGIEWRPPQLALWPPAETVPAT